MIRPALVSDIPVIMDIFDYAREQMRRQGNAVQWVDGYPQLEIINDDIAKGNCWVMEDEAGVYGVFAFIIGADPTYTIIEEGRWLNDEPYGTIHRIASSGRVSGVLAQAVEFCSERIANLRIDTHEKNAPMRHLLERLGFEYCGIIYTRGHSPRLAFQFVILSA